MRITTAAITMPMIIMFHGSPAPNTPCDTAAIRVACGAASDSGFSAVGGPNP